MKIIDDRIANLETEKSELLKRYIDADDYIVCSEKDILSMGIVRISMEINFLDEVNKKTYLKRFSLTKMQVKNLKKIRNYFGKNDVSELGFFISKKNYK